MNIRSFFNCLSEAFSNKPPENTLTLEQIDKVRERLHQTSPEFEVKGQCAMSFGKRNNVGIVVPEGISFFHRWTAESKFMDAMKDIAGVEIADRNDVIKYDGPPVA